jgi:hypothetical protein
MRGMFQSNPDLDNWKTAKKVIRYLQEINDYMIIYRKYNHFEMDRFSNSNFTNVWIQENSYCDICFFGWKSNLIQADRGKVKIQVKLLQNFISKLGIINNIMLI